MASVLQYFAPAKVNLCLHVTGKRHDGYHELDTCFERLSFGDDITFIRSPRGITMSANSSEIPVGKDNLCYRAAKLLQEKTRTSLGAHIHLVKNTPVAAGLGGGSSDAASTLMGLNQLWNLRLKRKKLLELAALLGSDVPFFILDSAFARGKGRGEVLTPFRSSLKIWHILVNPGVHVLTKDIYQKVTPSLLTLPGAGARMHSALAKNQRQSWPVICHEMHNTLGCIVEKLKPITSKVKNDLVALGADQAMVSGSGPTVFGITKSQGRAIRIAQKMRSKYPKFFIQVASTYSASLSR